jgi:hypothetical protein
VIYSGTTRVYYYDFAGPDITAEVIERGSVHASFYTPNTGTVHPLPVLGYLNLDMGHYFSEGTITFFVFWRGVDPGSGSAGPFVEDVPLFRYTIIPGGTEIP